MADAAVRQQFMLLRAQGKSFDAISRQLNVRKQTLIAWENACKEEITNMKALELEELRERFWLSTKAQTELFGEQLSRVVEELGKRDLADVATPKLMDMLMKLVARLETVCPAPVIRDEAQIAERKALRASLSSAATPRETLSDEADNSDALKANFLVSVLLTMLRRYEDGEIDERTVKTEVGLLASLFKGVELTSIEQQNERILGLLKASGLGVVRIEQSSHA